MNLKIYNNGFPHHSWPVSFFDQNPSWFSLRNKLQLCMPNCMELSRQFPQFPRVFLLSVHCCPLSTCSGDIRRSCWRLSLWPSNTDHRSTGHHDKRLSGKERTGKSSWLYVQSFVTRIIGGDLHSLNDLENTNVTEQGAYLRASSVGAEWPPACGQSCALCTPWRLRKKWVITPLILIFGTRQR